MSFTLNIGQACADGRVNTVAAVMHAVRSAGLVPMGRSVTLNSDTEPTVVLRVRNGYSYVPMAVRLAGLAEDLGQDCIAAYNEQTANGALYGPRAAAWGTFNPEFFFMPDGTRMAQPATA